MATISAVINTKNVAKTLEATLNSLSFVDEIIVVDMQSTDDTLKIAKKYTAKVFSLAEDFGYVEPARNIALAKVSSDWTLVIDADEVVPESLQRTLKAIAHGQNEDVQTGDCYYVPRKNLIFGSWIQHTGWWPDYILRFFRTGYVEWSDQIHSVPITKGVVRELPAVVSNALEHTNYTTIEDYLERLNRYTKIQSQGGEAIAEYSPQIFLRFFTEEFLRRLFAEEGIKDGNHGVVLSLLQSHYQLTVLLQKWQREGFPQKIDQDEVIKSLRCFQKELNYWLADWQVKHQTGLRKLWWQVRRKAQI